MLTRVVSVRQAEGDGWWRMISRGEPKVFCLGVSKTGTTSFGVCMSQLGYRHLAGFLPEVADLYLNGDFDELDRLVDIYDSFDDWPWPALYRRYAVKYPQAKFVLTRRTDPETWLRSYRTHCETYFLRWIGFGRYNRAFFGAAYPHGQGAAHKAEYLRHLDEVRRYFSDQPDRLLELCFETDAVWEKLSGFVDREPPDVDPPHSNVRRSGVPARRRAKRVMLGALGRVERIRGRTPPPPVRPEDNRKSGAPLTRVTS